MRGGDPVGRQTVAELTQLLEPGSGVLWVFGQRGEKHQPHDARGGAADGLLEDVGNPVDRGAVFRRFARQIDLDEQLGARPAAAAASSTRRSRSALSMEWISAQCSAAFRALFD